MNKNENTALYAFRKFGDDVLRAAYAGCGSYAEAEDITQEVFLTLHSKQETFTDDDHLRAWLLRCTMNRCLNYRKSFRVSRTGSLEDIPEMPGNPVFNEAENEIREALSRLPEKYAAVLYLYYYEGYNTREIGDMLDRSENTVSSLLRRGREKLRIELEEEGVTI